MPASLTIVTFTDAEGDEFPVRVPGTWQDYPGIVEFRDEALRVLERLVDTGELRPTYPVTQQLPNDYRS